MSFDVHLLWCQPCVRPDDNEDDDGEDDDNDDDEDDDHHHSLHHDKCSQSTYNQGVVNCHFTFQTLPSRPLI